MRKNIKLGSLLLAIIFCLTAAAFGQERTGMIEGTIKDSTGAVIPNATVQVEGNSFNRTATTDDSGFFRIQQVPPGVYKVSVSAGNFQTSLQNNVSVSLGSATVVDTELRASGVSATVNVTGDNGIATIDPTSSKIQTNLSAARLEELPKGVNFTSALKAAAPVRPEVTAGGFQIDGATGSENSFVIDGQEVTNFRDGTLNRNNNVPFQIVQELQVKSNGFEAEFGGATGGVINVVTKRGSDQFNGAFQMQFETSKLLAGEQRKIITADTLILRYLTPRRDDYINNYPSFYLGGPIVKGRLNFFVSHTPQFQETNRDYTFRDGSTRKYRSEFRADYDFIRLDGRVTDNLQLVGTFLYNPLKVNGTIPGFTTLDAAGSAANAPSVFEQSQFGGRQASINYNFEGIYTPTQNLSIDVRGGRSYLNEIGSSYGIPNVTRYTCSTGNGTSCNTGFTNVTNNNGQTKDISIRKTFDVNVGIFVNRLLGRHSFKFGYQYNGISNDLDTGYVSTGSIDYSFGGNTTDAKGCPRGIIPAGASIPAGCSANPDPTALGVGTLTLFGEFGKASSKNEGIYAQDSWQIGKRLTLNLGVRAERENVPPFNGGVGIKLNFSDKLAPRLGFAYDVLGNAKWKIFGSYGTFFDRFKYELPRGSFGGNTYLVYDFIVTNPNIFSNTRASILANNINVTDFRTASNLQTDNRIDPSIKSYSQREITFGTAYDFGKNFILEGRYTHKNLIKGLEDIGFHDNSGLANEYYFIGNPGFGVCAQAACGQYTIPGFPTGQNKGIRIYDAVEVRAQKRLGNFSLDSSYTFSRLIGNYPGLSSSDEAQRGGGAGRNSPGVNRLFDVPFIGFTADGISDKGRLPTDRPHYFKFYGNYTFDWFGSKTNATDFNLGYFISSGTPVTSRFRIANVSGQILSGRGDLGRLDTLSQTDISLSHKYSFGRDNRYSVAFDFNVLNLFDQDTELSRRETITRLNIPISTFGCTDYICIDRAFFNGAVTSAKVLTYANSGTNKDLRYNQPQLFQDPRIARFGFRFMF